MLATLAHALTDSHKSDEHLPQTPTLPAKSLSAHDVALFQARGFVPEFFSPPHRGIMNTIALQPKVFIITRDQHRGLKVRKVAINLSLSFLLFTLGVAFLAPIRAFSDGTSALVHGHSSTAMQLMYPLPNLWAPKVQLDHGIIYFKGDGISQDYVEALKWFQRAADRGDAIAQSYLGVMYGNGLGVQKDFSQEFKWNQKSAEQGYSHAQANLALMYAQGVGTPQNYPEAFKWYSRSADQGYAAAQTGLGIMYSNGYGVAQDFNRAVKWNQMAAAQGDTTAEYNLATSYYNGQEGVTQDYAEALKWASKAADKGNSLAKKLVVNLQSKGYSVAIQQNNMADKSSDAQNKIKVEPLTVNSVRGCHFKTVNAIVCTTARPAAVVFNNYGFNIELTNQSYSRQLLHEMGCGRVYGSDYGTISIREINHGKIANPNGWTEIVLISANDNHDLWYVARDYIDGACEAYVPTVN